MAVYLLADRPSGGVDRVQPPLQAENAGESARIRGRGIVRNPALQARRFFEPTPFLEQREQLLIRLALRLEAVGERDKQQRSCQHEAARGQWADGAVCHGRSTIVRRIWRFGDPQIGTVVAGPTPTGGVARRKPSLRVAVPPEGFPARRSLGSAVPPAGSFRAAVPAPRGPS